MTSIEQTCEHKSSITAIIHGEQTFIRIDFIYFLIYRKKLIRENFNWDQDVDNPENQTFHTF